MNKQIHDRFVDENGNVFRKTKNGLVLCKYKLSHKGYYTISINGKGHSIHRLVWEAFNGEIPTNMQIDHIDCVKTNNKLNNLRLVTPKQNINNPITLAKRKLPRSVFGKKFYDHFNMVVHDNVNLYDRERAYYRKHGKCRWEV